MEPLHIRLLVSHPEREDVVALREALRAGGHLVVHDDGSSLPADAAVVADFVVTEGAALPTPESLEAAERKHIAAMLRFTRGNKRKAALLLGIARSTLLAKVRRYHLE